MKTNKAHKATLAHIQSKLYLFERFTQSVSQVFTTEPDLVASNSVHTVRTRIKTPDRILDKIARKHSPSKPVNIENVFNRITDLAGVRVLHLYHGQFPRIHASILRQVAQGEWVWHEEPKAFTWDPEMRRFFKNLGLQVELRESLYTSIHYVVRPKPASEIACEIQVRTLLEEVWGEIDHALNYPHPTPNQACRDQLGVLARLVSAGSRLSDSIFRAASEIEGNAANAAVGEIEL